MKAIQLAAPKELRSVDVPDPMEHGDPSDLAPGDAIVRVRCVGICGTDYGGYWGKMPFFSYPRIFGHELGVEVVALGAGVENVQVGDACCVEPYLNCQQCYACRRGHTNCCQFNQTLGVHCDGGLQRHYKLPARKLHRAHNLTPSQAALVETLAIGRHAVQRGNPVPGENILIIGAGPIGLSALEFAKISGARTLVMDTNPQRLAFVRERMGIADTIAVGQDPAPALAELDRLTDGQWADVVIDATGNHHSMAAALDYTAIKGRIVYVGITQQLLQFPQAPRLHAREQTILASRNALPDDFRQIVTLIENGTIDTRPWITHQSAFDDLLTTFPEWLKPESGVIKGVVHLD